MEGITEGDDNDGNGNGGRIDDNDVADDIHIISEQYNKGLVNNNREYENYLKFTLFIIEQD